MLVQHGTVAQVADPETLQMSLLRFADIRASCSIAFAAPSVNVAIGLTPAIHRVGFQSPLSRHSPFRLLIRLF